ncbi:PREDICTED: uncharacterized protein LOC107344425 [Acropora digitifera]|uniref:uncharacterized protein LOC107344425 n=1 Tax=Acropora digitifera TaxID=70779 RepID=UPI00077B05CA|nr:PREDICTED: uncharacterized protein LOC107344425 [Acropora digitifera]
MYLRIEIAPEDRPFHRFLWRDVDQEKVPEEYKFSRVVFGVNSSPFLAQFVTQQHAETHRTEYPLAAETALKSTYMDDSMDSVADDQNASQKLLSSSPVVLSEIPREDRASEIDLKEGSLPSIKTLGILWQAAKDAFTFKVQPPANHFSFTKRIFLSKVATLFDPLGFLAPFIIRAKVLLQDLWAAGLDWDDPFGEALVRRSRNWFEEMPELAQISVSQSSSSSQKEFRPRGRFSKAETNKGQESTLTAATINESRDWRLNPQRFSSWTRLLRVHAWVSCFLENCCLSKDQRITGELTIDEIRNAENQIIVQAQQQAFPDKYGMLAQGKNLPHSSKPLRLRPVLDEDKLDGRLRYAECLPYDTRFPIILPRGQWVTTLIVKHYHEKGYHASGTNQTIADLSSRFWIIEAREEIRAWEKNCTECRKRKAKPASQVMAPLPRIRAKEPLRAFSKIAVDFAGPFFTIQGGGKARQKRYLCLFTCLLSRAVHLELAFGLDTDAFLNTFYRMVNRRGLPQEVVSDNGGNFVGAEKEQRELAKNLDEDKIQRSVANKGIRWHFNPPLAPHFGGVHEIMIKAAKRGIFAILGSADVNDEELMTAFTGAEALINSRPLTYQFANPSDDVPLTPNQFLYGQIGGQFAPESVDDNKNLNIKKRWRRIQELVKHFWRRWMNAIRGQWPLARVIEVYPGEDGRVRVAKVQVGRNTLTRSISKLCPLEICKQ